jgi:hypothetical protein
MTTEELAAVFHEQVVTTYFDFVEQNVSAPFGNSQDLRAGLLAAVEIYHFREHLSGPLALSFDDVLSRCPDYSLVRDVADIAKHRVLDRRSAKLRGPEAIQEVVVVTQYQDEFGEYRHSEKCVDLLLPDGVVRSLAEVLTNTMVFWRDYLRSHKVPLLELDLKLPEALEPRPRAKCKEVPFSVMRGLRFTMAHKIRRYNYETEQVEPVDLSHKELHYRIFEPKYKIDVALVDKRTGEELTRTIVLNPDQSEAFDKLETDEARQEFLADTWQFKDACARLLTDARRDDSNADSSDMG